MLFFCGTEKTEKSKRPAQSESVQENLRQMWPIDKSGEVECVFPMISGKCADVGYLESEVVPRNGAILESESDLWKSCNITNRF